MGFPYIRLMRHRRLARWAVRAVDLDRRLSWRLGRAVYMLARRDVANQPARNGEYLLQREMLRIARRRHEAAVFFDVGANVGEWTRTLMGRVESSDELTVHCFEPFPGTFETLSANLEAQVSRGRVVCRSMALSSEDGEARMTGDTDIGTSALTAMDDDDAVPVVKRRVDSYCAEQRIDRVHMIKVDTEGHDYDVLCGTAGLLERGAVGLVQFEYNHRWVYTRHFLRDVFLLAEDIDYGLGKVTPRGVELYASWHPELERFFEGNYALIRRDLVDELPTWRARADGSNTFA
ncbi:MAG: FkbM family methyltransferase [Myxococcota bacterium]